MRYILCAAPFAPLVKPAPVVPSCNLCVCVFLCVQPASSVSAGISQLQTKLFTSVEAARVSSLHQLDFLTSASQQANTNANQLSSAAFSFATTSFHWETYQDSSGNTQYKLVSS